ncbi:Protein NUCLEAR FUSION DEFECTIVE 4 [Hondaea fermentalgiana]|uniref:Protein NUCLEAR FUSION DEFECTIVE 4 n=1 Tax=Hondaea fermentalgiana TaxID=2315210 RepID=A0A2R5GRR4_9STRA|nr:Protein NUCLEAR FUSION DEFECTIVE 4 [Hondaea fermentalgiana]|eukprot:GBG33540.1 Protein NUCLEAR FUSION DEFECTIVE 4 [Hondaea fermentalgiana]
MGLDLGSRFTTLTFCVLLDSICGLQYIYGTFSVPIKNRFQLSQTVIDNGGLAQNIGNNFGIFAGPLLDAIGPKPVIIAAGLAGALSYMSMFLMYGEEWPVTEHPWILYVILFFEGQSQMLADMSIVVTVSRRFQDSRGLAIGLCKAFLGLSGSIAEQIQVTFFPADVGHEDDPKELPFVLFLSIYFMCICFIVAVFVQAGNPEEVFTSAERVCRRIKAVKVITSALKVMPVLLALLLGSIIWKFKQGEASSSRTVEIIFSVSIFICFGTLLALIARGNDGDAKIIVAMDEREGEAGNRELDRDEAANFTQGANEANGGNALTAPLLENAEVDALDASGVDETHEAVPATDVTVWTAMRDPAFWFHAMALLVGWGAALTLINNVGQICQVVGLSQGSKDLAPSLISIFNCIGRLGAGLSSDELVRRGVHRPVVFGVLVTFLGLVTLLLSLATPITFYAATVLVGLTYGALNVLSPAILGDLFGVKNIGALYSATMLAVIGGSFFIANKLFAVVYEAHAQRDAHGREFCVGASCIQTSTRVTALLCIVIGTIHATFFYRRFAAAPLCGSRR